MSALSLSPGSPPPSPPPCPVSTLPPPGVSTVTGGPHVTGGPLPVPPPPPPARALGKATAMATIATTAPATNPLTRTGSPPRPLRRRVVHRHRCATARPH